jgi:hypothetical protein
LPGSPAGRQRQRSPIARPSDPGQRSRPMGGPGDPSGLPEAGGKGRAGRRAAGLASAGSGEQASRAGRKRWAALGLGRAWPVNRPVNPSSGWSSVHPGEGVARARAAGLPSGSGSMDFLCNKP